MEDLSGKIFNRWKVLSLDLEKTKNGRTYWNCECQCEKHTLKSVRADHLKSGRSSSCGCLRTESIRENIENIVGKKYNHYTVLKQYLKDNPMTGKKETYCLCQCDCIEKTIKEVKAASLKNGSTKSCGCQKIASAKEVGSSKLIDLTGQKFYHWTVLKRDNENKQHVYWICQCDCENHTIKSIYGENLKRGLSRSCGLCQGNSRGEEYISKILTQNKINFIYQKSFDNCRFINNNKLAYFDFYLPDYNTIIEYDGQQHFFSKNSGWDIEEKLEERIKHDIYKNNWCFNNNIKLIRIPYKQLDSLCIQDLLPTSSQFLIKNNKEAIKYNENYKNYA